MINNQKTPSRTTQRIAGFLMAVAGSGVIIWIWRTALTEGYFYPKIAFLAPTLTVFGLGMIFFPTYREERINRGEDISQLNGLKLLTPRWWAVLVLAIALASTNLLLLYLF